MKTELSILIPTYNDCCLELVRQLAEQAQNIEDLHAYEIIVADDGSTEKETVEANRPINNIEHCRYIERLENKGRAIIRNFLAQQACHVWLLYIDSDMTVIRKDFLKTYLTCTETQVIYGGYKVLGSHQGNLRFMYEKRAERKHSAAMRTKKPHLDFHTSNFLVSKTVMATTPLDTRFRHYGYEDVLFGKILHEKNIRIAHIDNPLGFDRFENNDSFLAKTEEGLRTLYQFRNELNDYSRILQTVCQLRKFGLTNMVETIFRWRKDKWKAILCSNKPSILLLNFYKIGYFLSLYSKS
ncbi:glycosyltransferase family 2 protein [Hoylesella oralis]|uniref:glycosyltransferase family 2 protein n=1 Tax=Hoylesella oralis TaxID=28134 RepID=UPI0003D3AFDF|nr:hypothetical protein HMPREF1199_00593 [Hoylesella oralis CC98A]